MSLIILIWFLIVVIAVDLKQTVQVDKDLQIRAYYAGHVRLIDYSCAHGLFKAMFALHNNIDIGFLSFHVAVPENSNF